MKGIFIDCYALENQIVLWLWINGGLQKFVDTFAPKVYVHCNYLLNLQQTLASFKINAILKEKRLFTGESVPVLEISVYDVLSLRKLIKDIEREKGFDVDLYNADIPAEQYYLFDKCLFPFCEVEFYHDKGNVLAIKNIDVNEFEYTLPPLKVLELDIEADQPLEKGFLTGIQNIVIDGSALAGKGPGKEHSILSSFRERFLAIDPDIVLTHHGNLTLPYLKGRLQYYGLDFSFSRIDPDNISYRGGKSYFSYGKVLYKDYPVFLRGRLHLDKDAFLFREAGLYGVIELARACRMPVQKIGMRSPGSGISNLQCYQAFKDGCLIPYKKNLVESFKTALQLFEADRGGIIYEPITGFHENVAELDFASMYPSIMVRHNISPETILCDCCNGVGRGPYEKSETEAPGTAIMAGGGHFPDGKCPAGHPGGVIPRPVSAIVVPSAKPPLYQSPSLVPGINYHLCTKRVGLVPKMLKPIIERRLYYKSNPSEINNARKTALKWILVTCFGYMGFRKAKFGRIEAHEAINAFARQKLLQASRILERHGFQIVHGIIDSLYVKRQGIKQGTEKEIAGETAGIGDKITKSELNALCIEIGQETGIPISIEGIYRWMVFLPSAVDKRVPVPTRFYGLCDDGKVKMRGIEMRKSDTPLIVYRMQGEMFETLQDANDLGDFQRSIPRIIGILKRYAAKLGNGISAEELLITKRLSKLDYSSAIPQSIISRKMLADGINLRPGNSIQYIIRDIGAKAKECKFVTREEFDGVFDRRKYAELMVKAALVFLEPFGYTEGMLYHLLGHERQLTIEECA